MTLTKLPVVLVALVLVAGTGTARAGGAKDDIAAKAKAAMDSFDVLEFEAAKKQLNEALALARKANLTKDPVVAKVHIDLGIVYLAGLKDEEAATSEFADAVKVDPSIDIDVAYRTDQMEEMLAEVKKQAGGASDSGTGPATGTEPAASGGDCAGLEGMEHTLVDSGEAGKPVTISARVGDGLGASKVTLFYRAPGAVDFTQVVMTKGDGCSYSAEIPGAAMKGEAVHYYLAAQKNGKNLASRGSSGSPNIIEIASAGGTDPGDNENPLGSSGGGVVTGSVDVGGADKPHSLFFALSLGTGAGYVTGSTEVAGSSVGCCLAPALLHLFPEIGYYVTPQTSVSAAFRMGFALGANIMGHATAAPAGLLRVRHALAASGEGLSVNGSIGGGIIRHTVKVQDAMAGQDTDTTASGPFLLGAGVGYAKAMSGPMQFVAELNGLAAFPAGIKELGSCPGAGCVKPHFSFQVDVNVGVLFAF